ncbi:hypothetical protein N7474_003094 [Penicillium riverlandense]|uniref:uncharacterized protein n=1 Tax=Penicillium riverlandense TaxID=1903569 RepID=UPI002548AE7A|nr:uncharacterized protein N7474_003094 [Penicillium riverlandense]KAJ5825956.1 hypothetical protein N7474_003094 [Penicillium riverlandense]
MKFSACLTVLGLTSAASAGIYTFPAAAPNVAYSVTLDTGVPFFQIVASTSYQWVALGEGSQMPGANIFVIYASGSGNVTVSPRLGVGHFEPEFNPNAQVSLLEGSGIQDGYMTANIRCDSCLHWPGGSLDTASPASNWIWAVKEGSPLDTTDKSASIVQHDTEGNQAIDLTQATISSANTADSNPFHGFNGTLAVAAAAVASSGGGSSSGTMILVAHGFLMAFAFVVLFPSFAVSIHIIPYSKTVPRIHAPLQLFTLCVALAGLGLGVYLGVTGDLMSSYHPIIGLITVGSILLIQPLMGLSQHLHFRKTGQKAWFAYVHRWFGRFIILLGIINGGLGFMLAGIGTSGVPKGAVIAYSVIAAGVVFVYIAVVGSQAFLSKR